MKLDILINSDPVPEMSLICHVTKARDIGKSIIAKLKESLTRQQFSITLQAAVGSNILARDDIKALKKDVTAKCYGGDLTRQAKLLKHQAEGKKRLKMLGKVQVTKDTLVNLMKR